MCRSAAARNLHTHTHQIQKTMKGRIWFECNIFADRLPYKLEYGIEFGFTIFFSRISQVFLKLHFTVIKEQYVKDFSLAPSLSLML